MVGGAEWYVYNVSRELVRRGHEVHVFTADRHEGRTAPRYETVEGIVVHRIPLSIDWTYRLKAWDGLYDALLAQDFDIIHAYDYAQEHSAIAMRAGRQTKTGTVLTVFDIHSMIPRPWYKRYPMMLIDRFMARRTLANPSRVLVRAPNLVDPLAKLGADPKRILVTSSGVRDESLDQFDACGFNAKYGLDGAPVVLYVGRLNPLKGPQYLLDSAPSIISRFPRAQFVFVGPDQSGFLDRLKAKARRLGISSNVQFLGPIFDFDQKMAAYSSCSVFALPTSYEGTSQSIFEAMAQSKPVVATSVGGIPYQLTDGVEGRLVPYADVEALGAAIIQILGDQELSSRMGAKGHERAMRQRYSVLTTELQTIYEEVRNLN